MKTLNSLVCMTAVLLGMSGAAFSGESALKQLAFQVPGASEEAGPKFADAGIIPVRRLQEKEAGNWRHERLTSTNGTKIVVDYRIMYAKNTIYADPVWINVSNPGLDGGKTLQVTMTHRYRDYLYAGDVKEIKETTLAYAGDNRYTGQMNMVELSVGGGGSSYNFYQEIEVKVITTLPSGKKQEEQLIDPMNGSPNFTLHMTWY